jgi:hypothetical protein
MTSMRPVRLGLAVVACAMVAMPSSASAQGKSLIPPIPLPIPLPVPLSVEVVKPDASAPAPTGTITFVADGIAILVRDVGSTTDLTAIAVGLAVAAQNVTVTYSGDDNYERSDPVRVTFPGESVVSIRAVLKDSAAPAIEILSPGDGVRYEVGESVVAVYSCTDARSTVTRCEGPVAAGALIDTSTTGRYSFAVTAADASGHTDTKTVTFSVEATAKGSGSGTSAGTQGSGQGSAGSGGGGGGGGGAAPSARPATAATAAAGAAAAAQIQRERSAAARPTPKRAAAARPKAKAKASPKPTKGSSDEVATRPAGHELGPYDARSNPTQTVGIFVAAFTLLQLAGGGGGLAGAGGGGGVGRSASRRGSGRHSSSSARGEGSGPEASFDYESVDVEHLAGGAAVVAVGDRSRTWGWPGTATIDALGATLPARLAPRSPLLARVTADGTYLRAVLGSAWLLAPLAGIALGVVALLDVDGEAIPPAATLTIAIAMLGVLDAFAGLLAVLILVGGVLVAGGFDSNAHLRLMLGLAALWFVVPVLAGAVRPLRREATRNLIEGWDRATDFVIASLIGAWAVQKIVLALPGLAGEELALTPYANTAAYCVLAALVVRLGLETLAAHLYPWRLNKAEPGDLPEPGALQRLGATALRTAIFVFFAYVVVGTSWQLFVGAALFVIPQVLAVYEEHVPNSPGLFRTLPKGLVELVLMLFVGSVAGALLISAMDENAETFAANSFAILSLPGFVLSLLQLFGREGDEPRIGWGKRIAGVGLVVFGVFLALGLVV